MTTDSTRETWPSSAFRCGIELTEQGEYHRALDVLRSELTNRSGIERAECLRWIARAEAQLDAITPAVEALTEAVAVLAGEPVSVLSVDCALLAGEGLTELNRAPEAVPYLRTAATGLRVLAENYGSPGDPEWLVDIAECDASLATALADTGDFAGALPVFRSAALGFTAAGQLTDAADCRSACGAMAIELDDARLVYDEFRSARAVFDQLDAIADSAHCSLMIGIARTELGDNVGAIAAFQRARAGFDTAGQPESTADCDAHLGEVYSVTGRTSDAINALTSAAAEYARSGAQEQSMDCYRKLAVLHVELGMGHLRCGRNQAALDEIAAVRRACEAVGDLDLVAEVDVMAGMALDDLDNADANAAYHRARAHYLRTGQALEVAWCDANLATARLAAGDVEGGESELVRVSAIFQQAGDRGRLAKCRLYLANAAMRRSAFDEALRLLEGAHEYSIEADDRELRAECCRDIGAVLVQTREYSRAIARLAEASRTFDTLSELMKGAACRQQAAVASFFLGRHAEAEDLLFEARAVYQHAGALRWVAGVDAELGLIYSGTGRFEESERAYLDAMGRFEALGANEDRALAGANLGGLYLRRGQYEDAALAYGSAEEIFLAMGRQHQAMVCRENLGAVAIMRGDAQAGRELAASACAYFRSDPAFRWNTAAAHRNSSVSDTYLENWGSAREHLGQARRIQSELGLMFEVAKCDFWEGVIIVGESKDDGLRRALDVGLPAMVFIDAQRFQFPHAASRIAWTELNTQIRGTLFDWAGRLGDAELMTDLIEVSVNAGMHVTTQRTESTAQHRFSPLIQALDADIAPVSQGRRVAAPAPIRPIGGAAALISGAMLPMRPPPNLLMPDGRIALATHLGSATARYGAAERTYTVPTW